MWHASAAPLPQFNHKIGKHRLKAIALKALASVGDASLGEWYEWTGRAYHIRRRLTQDEQSHVGDAVDVRGTSESLRRIERVKSVAPYVPLELLAEEM